MKGYKVKTSTLRELDNTSFVLAILGVIFLIIVTVAIIMAYGDKGSNNETISEQSSTPVDIVGDESRHKEGSPSVNVEVDAIADNIKAPSTVSAYYEVVRVVDGDTVDVSVNGQSVRVRLIGVNTPETVHPSKPVECFGREASNYTHRMLSGKKVQLELDSSQDTYDAYNRLLAYVYINGDNFNYMLLRNGYAYEYTYNIPYKYQTEFKHAQRYASSNNIGLWNPNVCSN